MKTRHSFYNMYRTAGDERERERERERELAVVWPNNMCLPACLPVVASEWRKQKWRFLGSVLVKVTGSW